MYNLTLLQQYGLDAPLARQLRRLYDSTACAGHSRALVCFALARIHEGHADHDRDDVGVGRKFWDRRPEFR